MNDNQLPEQLESMSRAFVPGGKHETALLRAAAALRACDADLATARAVTGRLYRAIRDDEEGMDLGGYDHLAEALQAVAACWASVSPPASRDDQ